MDTQVLWDGCNTDDNEIALLGNQAVLKEELTDLAQRLSSTVYKGVGTTVCCLGKLRSWNVFAGRQPWRKESRQFCLWSPAHRMVEP